MINVNEASREELIEVQGIGRVTAKNILDYRKENGSFKTLDELTGVKGIGTKKLEKLKEFITVNYKERKKTVEIAFNPEEYDIENVQEVHLVGTMNEWNPQDKSYPLHKEPGGVWKNSFNFAPGVEYKIMYDSSSWDENRYIGNEYGENFVICS